MRCERDLDRRVRGGAAVSVSLPISEANGIPSGIHIKIAVAPYVQPVFGGLQRLDRAHFQKSIESEKAFEATIQRSVYKFTQSRSDLLREVDRLEERSRSVGAFFESRDRGVDRSSEEARRKNLEKLRDAAEQIAQRQGLSR